MKLHNDMKFFGDTIRAASQQLNINEVFVEKDYWITLVLCRLSKSKFSAETVFKGGTKWEDSAKTSLVSTYRFYFL